MITVTAGAVAQPIDPGLATTAICVTFFEDANQNRIQDGGEDALAGGQVLLTRDGAPAGTHQTGADADPYCFADLLPGSYDLQGVAPSGYGLTTPDQLHVSGYAGAQIDVAFGAAEGVAPVEPPPADASSGEVATPAADTGAANERTPRQQRADRLRHRRNRADRRDGDHDGAAAAAVRGSRGG